MATNHVRRSYTERDQAKVAVVLQSNEGNIKRTARETGVPRTTVRSWKTRWDKEGYPEGMAEAIERENKSFIEEAEEVRWIALESLREKAERRELRGGELVAAVSMLTDKINVAKGLATNRTERIDVQLPNPQELAKALAAYVGNTVELANIRSEEIEDADFEQVPRTLELMKG